MRIYGTTWLTLFALPLIWFVCAAESGQAQPVAPTGRPLPATPAGPVETQTVSPTVVDPLQASLAPVNPARACTPVQIQFILSLPFPPGSPSDKDAAAFVDCSLTLSSQVVVRRRLIFEGPRANGVTVECNGAHINGAGTTNNRTKEAMVEIRSSAAGQARSIRLHNCNIDGRVAVHWGFDWFDSDKYMRMEGYSARVRSIAPRDIVFDHVVITGNAFEGLAPLYLFPGVSHFQLLNSEITGDTPNVNIYVDAESYGNVFRNNYIHARLSGHTREVMSLDGSSHNVIVDNHFSALENGGIYLYRNWGEGGAIRHATPSYNTIVNNYFYYDRYGGPCPAIYVGSRTNAVGRKVGSDSDDCQKVKKGRDLDRGYPFGSSVSDYDYAQFNVVMQNQIRKRSPNELIRVSRPNDVNVHNEINYNETVTDRIDRRAGCFVKDGYDKNFILDGEMINKFRGANGKPACTSFRYTCEDGTLKKSGDLTCQKIKPPDDRPRLQPQN